jgi:hypothetical protein
MQRANRPRQRKTLLTGALLAALAVVLLGCPAAGSGGSGSGSENGDGDGGNGNGGGDAPPSYWASVLTTDESETPKEVVATDDGYLVVGERSDSSTEATNIWAVKLDLEGSVVWEKLYSASGSDTVAGAFETNDGGFIIGGNSEVTDSGGETQDLLLLKVTSNGALSWAHAFDLDLDAQDGANNEPFSVAHLDKDLAGNVLLGGTADLGNGEDPVLLEVDTGGNAIQAYSLAYPDFQSVGRVLQLGEERFIFFGTTDTANGVRYFAARFDADLQQTETVWAKEFSSRSTVTPKLEAAYAFDGGVIVVGPKGNGILSLKLDPLDGSEQGSARRSESSDGALFGGVEALTEIENDDFMAISTIDAGGNRGKDFFLLHLQDDDALPVGAATIEGEGYDRGHAVATTAEGGVISAGTTAPTINDRENLFVHRGDGDGIIPGTAFNTLDAWNRYPETLNPADVGPFTYTSRTGSIYPYDVTADVTVTSVNPGVSPIHP